MIYLLECYTFSLVITKVQLSRDLCLTMYCLHFYISGGTRSTKHSLPKRVNVVKKEELLGEDTNRIDEAEYKLQSMVSPETHEANRFFNTAPSKEIGRLRVDTMSPAQVSFIQSSTQWHKYYKPSSPTPYSSNIYPEDPVLFPGFKPFRGSQSSQSSQSVGYTGGIEGLGNEGAPRQQQHHPSDDWNVNSYGQYGDTGEGDQPQKDYENSPFTDKSWWNSKSEGRTPSGYESFDGKTLAVPEPKNDQELTNQDEMSGPLSHSASRSNEMLGGGGLGNARPHSNLLGEEKLSLFNKLNGLKDNGVIPQEEDEKVFFNGGNQKLLAQSGVASPPLDPIPGPSRGLGTALAEELLQKNRGNFRDEGESTNIIQGIREAASALRSGADEFDESQLLSKPLMDEKGVQRTTMYRNREFDSDRGHVVLIRSHQVKENTAKKHVTEHAEILKNVGKQRGLADKRNNGEGNKKHIPDHAFDHRLSYPETKLKASKKSIASINKRLCNRCSFSTPFKKFSIKRKIHRQDKDR